MELADRDTLYARSQHPYTHSLMSAVPIADPDKEQNRERILLEGDLPSPINPPPGCVFNTRCYKAQEICRVEVPQLVQLAPGHQVACHFPEERDLVGVIDVDIDELAASAAAAEARAHRGLLPRPPTRVPARDRMRAFTPERLIRP